MFNIKITIVGLALSFFFSACIEGGSGSMTSVDAGDATQDSDGANECPNGIECFVDFPCASASRCSGEDTVRECHTIQCEQVCGTPCCSGAICETGGEVTCEEGFTCVESPYYGHGWGWIAACISDAEAADVEVYDPATYDGESYVIPESYGVCSW